MYHPERFDETIGQTIRGIKAFTDVIHPYFLPHQSHEIFEGPPKMYRPRTFNGIYRHRYKFRRGEVVMPREPRLHQKYLRRLALLHEQELTSTDGLNEYTREITDKLKRNGVSIERNWFPYQIPQKECMQFSVWYDSHIHPYMVAQHVATAAYTEGLDTEDLAIWVNIPRNKSIPSINHAQLIVKYYPEIWNKLFERLPVNFMHPDIYSPVQPSGVIYPV